MQVSFKSRPSCTLHKVNLACSWQFQDITSGIVVNPFVGGPGRSEPKWTQHDSHSGRWRVHIQNIKVMSWHWISRQSRQGTNIVFTLDNKAAGKPMPAVTFDGAVVERTSHLRYLGIYFDRMPTYRKHMETTALKCKKRSVSPEGNGCKGQRHLFLLYESVVLSVMITG